MIPPKHGALVVQSPAAGSVYLNGRAIGETGPQPIVTPCGRRYVRVGVPPEPGRQITWLTKGVSAVIACGTTTTIEVPPLPLTRVK